MTIQLLHRKDTGKRYFGLGVDTPLGLNPEILVIWDEISFEKYNKILSLLEPTDDNNTSLLYDVKDTDMAVTYLIKEQYIKR